MRRSPSIPDRHGGVPGPRRRALRVAARFSVLLQLVGFALPAVVSADAYGDAADTFWLLVGLAAGGSALLAALAMTALGSDVPEETSSPNDFWPRPPNRTPRETPAESQAPPYDPSGLR